MNKLTKFLLDNKVTLGVELGKDGEPAWVVRPATGVGWYCAFRLPPQVSLEDAMTLYIKPATKALKEGVGRAAEDLPTM